LQQEGCAVVTSDDGHALRSGDGAVSGRLFRPEVPCDLPLLVCIHGGGSNGRYFQLKGRSLADMAIARGFPVLLIDRPGHAGNPAFAGSSPIANSVPAIRCFIDEVRAGPASPDAARSVVVIGHSIGGAVALHLAADRAEWPLLGIAVSGIGDVSPAAVRAMPLPAYTPDFAPPSAFAEAIFHDPARTLDWKALASLRTATEPWRTAEVTEIVNDWPAQWSSVARAIDVPVHLRLAEHDRIWETGETAVARMAAAITRSPRIDAGLLLDGGHLYEAHRNGRSLIEAQLDFLEACAATSAIAAPIRSCSSGARSG
jgi:pimeloyl-ACP methyl ester carboxylesterase